MTHRILVVDDEPSVTDLLAYNLRKAGYDILLAAVVIFIKVTVIFEMTVTSPTASRVIEFIRLLF